MKTRARSDSAKSECAGMVLFPEQRQQLRGEAGEEPGAAGDRDDGPARALRLQQDGVYLIDLATHLPHVVLDVLDLFLEDREAFGLQKRHVRVANRRAAFSNGRAMMIESRMSCS